MQGQRGPRQSTALPCTTWGRSSRQMFLGPLLRWFQEMGSVITPEGSGSSVDVFVHLDVSEKCPNGDIYHHHLSWISLWFTHPRRWPPPMAELLFRRFEENCIQDLRFWSADNVVCPWSSRFRRVLRTHFKVFPCYSYIFWWWLINVIADKVSFRRRLALRHFSVSPFVSVWCDLVDIRYVMQCWKQLVGVGGRSER